MWGSDMAFLKLNILLNRDECIRGQTNWLKYPRFSPLTSVWANGGSMKAVAKVPCMTAPEIDPRLHTCLLDTLYKIVCLAFFFSSLASFIDWQKNFQTLLENCNKYRWEANVACCFFLRVFMWRLTRGLHMSRDSLWLSLELCVHRFLIPPQGCNGNAHRPH